MTTSEIFASQVRAAMVLPEEQYLQLVEIFNEATKPPKVPPPVTIEDIESKVGAFFEVEGKLKRKTRKREIVQPRQISMFLAKNLTRYSLKTIGIHFGGKDHTTVIHSCQVVKDLMDTDELYKNAVLGLAEKLGVRLTA